MWIIRFLEKIIENPNERQKLKKVFVVVGLALVILDAVAFFLHWKHVVFFWDYVPGFMSIFAYVSTIGIILFSKALGHAWLMKPEDYYDD